MWKIRQTVCLIPRNRVYRNQFDNKILFVLRGEHVQGASKCIVGFPASDQVERRMGPIEVSPGLDHLRSSSVIFLSDGFVSPYENSQCVSTKAILVVSRISECEE